MPDLQSEAIEEPDLSSTLGFREKALRDKFVNEYLVDYDAFQACIRIGYSAGYAKEYCVMLMQDSYVLQQIRNKETIPETEATPEERKKRIISMLNREANYRGPGCSASARVAAIAKLAAIEGLDAPHRSSMELTGPDGQPLSPLAGAFVVPGLMTPEQWEAAAMAQQDALTSAPPPGSPVPTVVN